ncbi:hypothetical protein ACQEXU_11355 [Vibrio sp. TRT 21S02]|uniref:hypothetical protein n=1 Tax=Vibrio sp. TRT 21S02 TaxID=3418507 RepID=UPI003CEB7173
MRIKIKNTVVTIIFIILFWGGTDISVAAYFLLKNGTTIYLKDHDCEFPINIFHKKSDDASISVFHIYIDGYLLNVGIYTIGNSESLYNNTGPANYYKSDDYVRIPLKYDKKGISYSKYVFNNDDVKYIWWSGNTFVMGYDDYLPSALSNCILKQK